MAKDPFDILIDEVKNATGVNVIRGKGRPRREPYQKISCTMNVDVITAMRAVAKSEGMVLTRLIEKACRLYLEKTR